MARHPQLQRRTNSPFVVSLSNHGRLSKIALMPRGSHFLLRRQKKVTKEEAAPTFALIRDLKRKRRAVRNSLRSNNGPLHRRFHFKSRGRMDGDPFERMFDRCAIDSLESGASMWTTPEDV